VRKFLVAAVVGVLALAVAAMAFAASPQYKQTGSLKYTKTKAAKSTAINVKLKATDPGATPQGNLPPVKTVTIKLAKGTKANPNAARALCKLPKAEAPNCPKKSKIGSGKAKANLVGRDPNTGATVVNPSTRDLPNDVTAYAKKGGIYLVVKGTKLATTVVLDASLSKKGVIKVNVERDVPSLPGGNKIVLTEFSLKTKAYSKRKGNKRKKVHLITTPKKCTKKGWTNSARLVYEGEEPHTVKTKQKCKK
jgi:hypothetical protein